MDNEEFALWIVDKLMDHGFVEPGWNGEDDYYDSSDVEEAIRRILMENEKEEEE